MSTVKIAGKVAAATAARLNSRRVIELSFLRSNPLLTNCSRTASIFGSASSGLLSGKQRWTNSRSDILSKLRNTYAVSCGRRLTSLRCLS